MRFSCASLITYLVEYAPAYAKATAGRPLLLVRQSFSVGGCSKNHIFAGGLA